MRIAFDWRGRRGGEEGEEGAISRLSSSLGIFIQMGRHLAATAELRATSRTVIEWRLGRWQVAQLRTGKVVIDDLISIWQQSGGNEQQLGGIQK